MRVDRAYYWGAAVGQDDFPEAKWPEILMVGRSNVGKSSVINTLLGRRKLAHTSNTPGKTRMLHFYAVNENFFLVDAPGYGYAKVSKTKRQGWAFLLEPYLKERKTLLGVLQLVDMRHPPTADDEVMVSWLQEKGCPFLIVANKCDKVSKGQHFRHLKVIREKLGLSRDFPVIPFSAVKRQGKEEVWRFLTSWLG